MNGYLDCVVLGATVEKATADKFREKLGNISSEEAITWFIHQIVEGQMHIERMDGAE